MPQPKRAKKRNELERKIHFYRAYCGKNEAGKPLSFKHGAPLAAVQKLPFTDHKVGGRYFEDVDSNVFCCWPDKKDANRAQFAVIRRDAFPQIEKQGAFSPLTIPANAGLVEIIHVRFFPKNIVGFDANFYGPRLPRFARYLNQVSGVKQKVQFDPLLRRDAVKELSGKDLRVFSMRIKSSEIATVAQASKSLGSAFEATDKVSQADEVQIILRPTLYTRGNLGARMMNLTKRLAKRNDIADIASEFKVDVMPPGKASQTIDLLGDAFIAETRILKQSSKGRALEPKDAFAKIEEAYEDRKQELEKAASLGM